MIEWADPWWLLALPLAALPWLRRRPRLPAASLAALAPRRTWRVALAPLDPLLGSAAVVLAVLALARPQAVDRQRTVEREGIDIVVVLDTSGSMDTEDYRLGGRPATRLEAAKEVVARFVDGRPDDRIGLVAFGEEAFTMVPLTLDHDGFAALLRWIAVGVAGKRATAIGDAIAVGARRLAQVDAPSRVMVLVTDGRNNTGQVDPLVAARAAAALGVRIYTVGVGSAARRRGIFGLLGGGGRELDERLLRAIAEATGGRYWRAADNDALRAAWAELDALEPSTAEVREFVHREERFGPLLALALALLALQALLGETVLRRLP